MKYKAHEPWLYTSVTLDLMALKTYVSCLSEGVTHKECMCGIGEEEEMGMS